MLVMVKCIIHRLAKRIGHLAIRLKLFAILLLFLAAIGAIELPPSDLENWSMIEYGLQIFMDNNPALLI